MTRDPAVGRYVQRLVKLRYHCGSGPVEDDVRDGLALRGAVWVRQYNGHHGLSWKLVDNVVMATRFTEAAAVAWTMRAEEDGKMLDGDRVEVVPETWDELALEVDECFLNIS